MEGLRYNLERTSKQLDGLLLDTESLVRMGLVGKDFHHEQALVLDGIQQEESCSVLQKTMGKVLLLTQRTKGSPL